MDVKKIAAAAIAAAMVGTAALATSPALLTSHLLTVSAASLQLSSSGDDVKQLQQNLIRLNYMKSGSDTGTFDETTDGAVKNLQKDYGLKADGIAGYGTLGLIDGLIKGTAKVVQTDASNVNVRTRTNTSGKIITTVDKGQKLTYESSENVSGVDWYKVTVNGTQGYICGKYATPLTLSPVPEQTVTTAVSESTDSKSIRVTGTILHVRSSASTSSKKLTTVTNGQTFAYTKTKTVNGVKWYYVKVNDNINGWVMGTFVKEMTAADHSGVLKVTGEILNVRSEASTDSEKITTLKKGQSYNYSDMKTVDNINWYYIQVDSSRSGWVLGTFISLSQTAATSTESGSLKVTGTILNVRTSASTSAKKLTTLKLGQTFTYSNAKTVNGVKWYYIRVNANLSGWVMGTYAYPTPNAPATTTTTTTTTAAPTTTTVAVPQSGTLKVTGTLVNVRSGASINDDILTTVKKGQNYAYTEVKDDWYYIRISSSQSGWILGQFVEATPNANATTATDANGNNVTAATQGNGGSGLLKITGSNVNVRADAGLGYDIVTTVKKDGIYSFTDVKDGWYYIQVTADKGGWVMGDYIQVTLSNTPTTVSTQPTATTAPLPESGTLKITGVLVNVRSGRSTSESVITTVKQGESYTYSDKQDGWYYIQVSGKSGWIMADFVQATPNATTTTQAPSTQTTQSTTTTTRAKHGKVEIVSAYVNIRSGIGSGNKVVYVAKKGETFTYTDAQLGWYYVQYSASQSGWVSGDYVVAREGEETTTTIDNSIHPAIGKLVVTGTMMNIRIAPDTTARKIAEARKDESFQYYYYSDNWYYIRLSSGEYGWILGTFVSATPYPTVITTTTYTYETTTTAPSASMVSAGGSESGVLEVTADSLSVRAGAGSSYDKVSEVSKGQRLEYIDKKDDWYQVVLSDNSFGWVMGTYVNAAPSATGSTTTEVTTTTETTASATESTVSSTETTTSSTTADSSTTQEPTTTTTAKTVGRKVVIGTVKVTGNLNVRSKASTSGAKLGTLKNGTTVVIAEKGKTWHKIEYGSGYGYVKASYIKDVKTTYESMILKYTTDYYYVEKGSSVSLALNVGGASISYSSSNAVNCPVDNKGVVNAKKEGLYTITAKSGLAIANTCVVVLKEPYTDIQTMKISAEGTKFIADWEGGGTVLPTGEVAFYPYQDVSGYWTIGYGHAKTTTASKSWSEERAISEFNEDIKAMIGESYVLTDERPYLTAEGATALLNADLNDGPYVKAVTDWAVRNGVKLNQVQFDALVSFCYNIGPALWDNDSTKFYLKSAIISHRSGDDAKAEQIIEGFCRYIKSSGKNYKGLWYRRRNEAELFLKGDYALDREKKFTLPSGITWA